MEYTGLGNNAAPINQGRCCDRCDTLVIYRRINDLRAQRRNHPERGDHSPDEGSSIPSR